MSDDWEILDVEESGEKNDAEEDEEEVGVVKRPSCKPININNMK